MSSRPHKQPCHVALEKRTIERVLLSMLPKAFAPDADAISRMVLMPAILQYAAPGRFYHGLDHLHECVASIPAWLFAFRESVNQDELEQTIWTMALGLLYHDVVYDPKAKDNEYRSAVTLLNNVKQYNAYAASMGLPEMDPTGACRLIRLTTHQALSEEPSASEKVALDIDLSGLGKDRHTFLKNERNIRLEFGHLSYEEWVDGRLKFINHFLKNRPTIFNTDHCRFGDAENQARRNLEYLRNYYKSSRNFMRYL